MTVSDSVGVAEPVREGEAVAVSVPEGVALRVLEAVREDEDV